MSSTKIIASLIPCKTHLSKAHKPHIGVLTLNKTKALNALDIEMIEQLQSYLDLWRNDASVVSIILESDHEKAFCAGGDIVSMYHAMASSQTSISDAQRPDLLASFFAKEYRLDYTIHCYPKPIICWGNGFIIGGGLGLFAGAKIKIVTESSKVSMPEIKIGLFPDVGASYFLNKLPKGLGVFLALSASQINAKDCVETKLADYYLSNENKINFVHALSTLGDYSEQNIALLCENMAKSAQTHKQFNAIDGKVSQYLEILAPLADMQNLADIDQFLQKLSHRNEYFYNAYQEFTLGSPLSAKLIVEQLRKGQSMALADCFRMELNMAYSCSLSGEFKEGIRALLIDKDNQANWLFKSHTEVPTSLIEEHFNNNFAHPSQHPLHDIDKVN